MVKVNTVIIDGEKLRMKLAEKNLPHGETSLSLGRADNYLAGCIARNSINKGSLLLMANLYGITYEDIKIEEKAKETPVAEPTTTAPQFDVEPLMKKLDAIMYGQQKSDQMFEEKMNDLIGTLNRLGNILMQSMEYQKSIMNDSDEIKGCVRQIKNNKH